MLVEQRAHGPDLRLSRLFDQARGTKICSTSASPETVKIVRSAGLAMVTAPMIGAVRRTPPCVRPSSTADRTRGVLGVPRDDAATADGGCLFIEAVPYD